MDLPGKEASLFKSTLKFYEHKQYKKGLKVCEQILKKNPHHGETVAMKGLFLGNLGRKDEGYEWVRQGIRLNIKSHICWHVYGLLYRADKNYEEAMKCYRNALRFEKDNLQILRDLAVLQLQMRSYEGHYETRFSLLALRPTAHISWIALAIAYHLLGKHRQAIAVIDAYLQGLSDHAARLVNDNEQSEIQLYKSMLLEESGDLEACLDHLQSLTVRGGNLLEFQTRKARMLLLCGRVAAAQKAYRVLFAYNPESREYLDGLVQSHQVDLQDQDQLLAFFSKLSGRLAETECLRHLTGNRLAARLLVFLKEAFSAGIPAAFTAVKPLYQGTAALLGRVAATLCQGEDNEESPTVRFWTAVFLAQHFEAVGVYSQALQWLDRAYAIDSKSIELHLHYARLLATCGQHELASRCCEAARHLDLSDRYLNSISCKLLLRIGRLEEAQRVAALFLKKGELSTQIHELVDMQCMWFALDSAACLARQGQWAGALKYYNQIFKHFEDFVDDQFDFHNYSLRRMTISSYIRLLRFEDSIFAQPYFKQAAVGAIRAGEMMTEKMASLSLDSLDDGTRWIQKLEDHCPRDPLTHLLGFDLFFRQKHVFKCTRSLYQLYLIDPLDPRFLLNLIKTVSFVDKQRIAIPLVNKHLALMTGGRDSSAIYQTIASIRPITFDSLAAAIKAASIVSASVADLVREFDFGSGSFEDSQPVLDALSSHFPDLAGIFASRQQDRFHLPNLGMSPALAQLDNGL